MGHDNRRDLAILLDGSVSLDERNEAATRQGLASTVTYRVVAAPLFAVWGTHPSGPEDVVPTPFGTFHAVVVPSQCDTVEANPSGIGPAARIDHLHQSFRAAIVALRLCSPPEVTSVVADEYGGLIGLLADTPSDAFIPDVDLLEPVMSHLWACSTLDALTRSGILRQAARLAGVHHSTMQSRVDVLSGMIGSTRSTAWAAPGSALRTWSGGCGIRGSSTCRRRRPGPWRPLPAPKAAESSTPRRPPYGRSGLQNLRLNVGTGTSPGCGTLRRACVARPSTLRRKVPWIERCGGRLSRPSPSPSAYRCWALPATMTARLEPAPSRGGDGPDLRRHVRGPDPYFHPYDWVVRGDMSRTRHHQNRSSEHCGTSGGRPCQTTQVSSGHTSGGTL